MVVVVPHVVLVASSCMAVNREVTAAIISGPQFSVL